LTLRLLPLLALLAVGAVGQAAAQNNLSERVERLEQEQARLRTELALLRDRLDALLGPVGDERIYTIPVGNSPVRGNPDANVTLVEFGDYQSDYAQRAEHVVKRLLQEYPRRLRFVFKHYPLTAVHPQAQEAALAALAAQRQEQFWKMHDLLFQNTHRLEPALYLILAEQVGLDVTQFDRDRRSLWALERMDEDEKAATAASVDAVPTFFLNGRRMETWRYDYLKAQIEDALDVAR